MVALGNRRLDQIVERRALCVLKNQLDSLSQPSGSLRPDLHNCDVFADGNTEDVRIAVVGAVDQLPFGEHCHGDQPVARSSGILVALFR